MATPANLMSPRMEELLVRVDSKFTLVTLSAMRAREINDYYNQLGEGLGKIVPPQVTSVSRKPLSIAMEEIEAGKIEPVEIDPEPAARRRGVARVVAGPSRRPRRERRDRRVQGGRGLPPPRRRGRPRRAGPHPRRAPLRRRAHLLRVG